MKLTQTVQNALVSLPSFYQVVTTDSQPVLVWIAEPACLSRAVALLVDAGMVPVRTPGASTLHVYP